MNLIFLAAGRGLRMGELTRALPKSLLPLAGGRSIMEVNLLNLAVSDLHGGVFIVGGHCWDEIKSFCERQPGPDRPHPVLNKLYEAAGPIRSITAALAEIPHHASLTVANGDTVFASGIYSDLEESPDGISLVVSEDTTIEPDDMGVTLDEDGRAESATKSIDHRRSGLLSAGLLCVRGAEARRHFDAAVQTLVEVESRLAISRPWHDLIGILHHQGTAAEPLRVDRSLWREFDEAASLTAYAALPTENRLEMLG